MVLDNTEIMLREEKSFLNMIKDYVKEGEWRRTDTNILATVPASKLNVAKVTGSDLKKIEVFQDTANNSGIYINTVDGLMAMGKSAHRSLLQRARIGGSALGELNRSDFSDIINLCLPVATGQALIRISHGKIRAVLGGDDNDYSIIDMGEVFGKTSEFLSKNFQFCEFLSGTFCHEMSVAKWRIKDDAILDAYAKAFKNVPNQMDAVITVADSDTGYSGANLYYSLRVDNKVIFLTVPMKVEHKKGNSLSDFEENLRGILPRIEEKMLDLSKLGNIKIEYPIDCIKHLMSKVGLGKKAISEITSKWEVMYGPGESNALDVYFAICETPEFAAQKTGRTSEVAILDIEERVARITTLDFKEYDYKD